MEMDYITFRSITPAQRGQRLLQQNGIATTLMRTPRALEDKGCGYALRLRSEHMDRAVGLLNRAQIPYRKVYPGTQGASV